MKKIALKKSQVPKKVDKSLKKEVDVPRSSFDYLEQTLQIA